MIHLRKATLEDKGLLLNWRNNPEIVQACGTQRPITNAEHDRWMETVLADPWQWSLYIAERHLDSPNPEDRVVAVGMGRIERRGEIGVLSYLVDPRHHGYSYSGHIIQALSVEAHKEGIKSLKVNARLENTASIRALLSAGFTISQVEMLTLEKTL